MYNPEELKQNKELIKLCKEFDLFLLVLFGSRAKGTSKKNSDFDFGFLSSKKLSPEKFIFLHEKFMNLLKFEKIDLIDLNSASIFVKKNIFLSGILIYEKEKGIFFREKWNSWSDFVKFKPYYKIQKDILKKEINLMIQNG